MSHIAPLAAILVGASILATGSPADAAQGPVGLGTAASFAVLAGSGITNTGPTTITGDIGTFPTPTETGFASITLNGTNHDGDAVTQSAKNSLVTAYNDAAGRTPATSVPVELGGTTLLAGVYTSPTFGLTGTLSLDAKGDPTAEFIFQAGSTLITASNSRVLLLNGADPCHVVWQVGSSATFGTGTQFVGDVLALTSITADTGAGFQGRLLAQNGAVTLDTNTITNANCAAPVASTTTTSTTVGTTSTTVGTTSTTVGTTSPTTVAASPTTSTTALVPGAISNGGSGGLSTGTAGPTTSPVPSGGSTSATPTASTGPTLPFTGTPISRPLGAGLVLIGLGGGALLIRRRLGTRRHDA